MDKKFLYNMVLAFNCGQMAKSMKVTSFKVKLMVKELFIMRMEIYTWENYSIVNVQVMGLMYIKMDLDMKVNGKMINKMEKEQKSYKMVRSSRANTKLDKKMVMGSLNGLTVLNIKVIGQIISLKVKESIIGQTNVCTKDNGKKICYMV